MSPALWLLGYAAVGFGLAWAGVRYAGFDPEVGLPVLVLWPLFVCVLVVIGLGEALAIALHYARRRP